MQEVKSHERSIISFRQITNSQLSRTHVFRVGISHVITSITAQPATIFFVLFSLVLGSAIAFIVPPLRGPDEMLTSYEFTPTFTVNFCRPQSWTDVKARS